MRKIFCGILFTALLGWGGAMAEPAPKASTAAAKHQKVTFEAKLVNGKKTWLPGDVKVGEGTEVEATIKNNLSEPHGFAIDGMVEPMVVNAGETKSVKFVAKGKGHHEVRCQLHPAHIGASLTVQ